MQDDDLEPSCDDDGYCAPCPPPPVGPSLGREVVMVLIGSLVSAAAPDIVRWLGRVGRRVIKSLHEPVEPEKPVKRIKRKDGQ
jgi:hypothetical protein